MQPMFQIAFHIPGTLAANVTIVWTAFTNCILRHVSSNASNNSDATLEVGTVADPNGYITAHTIGDSDVPDEKEDLTDFDGALALDQYPRISDGDVLELALDHDGASGTAAQNVTIVLTFAPG